MIHRQVCHTCARRVQSGQDARDQGLGAGTAWRRWSDDPPAVHNDLARFPWHNITMALGKKSNHSHMLLERELDARLTSRMSEHIGKRIARVEGHEDRRDDESLTADRYRHTFEVIRGRHRVTTESCSYVLWGEGVEWSLRGKKKSVLAANSESPDARDQALSFDTLGGLIQQGVTVVFQHFTSASLPKLAGGKMVLELRKKKIKRGLCATLTWPRYNTKKIKIKSRFFRVF